MQSGSQDSLAVGLHKQASPSDKLTTSQNAMSSQFDGQVSPSNKSTQGDSENASSLEVQGQLSPSDKPQDDFASLQRRIAGLAQELQDEILLQLIKLHLQPGKICLQAHHFLKTGRPYRYKLAEPRKRKGAGWLNIVHEAYQTVYPAPEVSIMYTLNKRWLKVARDVLYCGNDWIVPMIHAPTTERGYWYRKDDTEVKHRVLCLEISMGSKKTGFLIKGARHLRTVRLWSPKLYNVRCISPCEVLTDCGLESRRGKGSVSEKSRVTLSPRETLTGPVPYPEEEDYEKRVKAWIDANSIYGLYIPPYN